MLFKRFLHKLLYLYSILTNPLLKLQRRDPFTIPVIIINFNQLYYLRKQVDFYLGRGFRNIIIIDNNSTYPPLLSYYQEMQTQVTVEYMRNNLGHLVFFKNEELQRKYGQGYYIVTDADILPNQDLPRNFMNRLIQLLSENFNEVSKVGFALDISDIPNGFPHKEKVLQWENRFWKNELAEDVYLNIIDTTFALYKPQYPRRFSSIDFLGAIRVAGNFTARHGGWYRDPDNLSEEDIYYEKHASSSASWKISNDHIKDWIIND